MRKINYFLVMIMTSLMFSCSHPGNQKSRTLDLADMDTTASPVTDFDAYANGGWKKKNPLPDEKSRYGTFDKLDDQAKKQVKSLFSEIAAGNYNEGSIEKKIADFYSSGMDSANIESLGIQPIRKYLMQADSISTVAGLQKVVAQWHQMGIRPLFFMYADADQKNSSMEVAYLHQGGLKMPNRDYYLNKDERAVEIQKKYKAFIAGMFRLTGSPEEESAKQAETIYSLEEKMAQFSMSLLDQRDPYKVYHKMTVSGLNKIATGYDWAGYFKEIGLNDPGELIVSQPDFFAGIGKMMQTEPLESWKLYMKWQLVSSLAGYLPKAYSDLSFAFYGKTLSGSLAERPRWKKVQAAVDASLSEAVGQLYVTRYFPPEAKQRMVKLVENLRTSLGQRIQNLSWMGDTTKQKAMEKLEAITVKVGYPDKWRDYSKLQVSKDNYIENMLNAGRFHFQRTLSKINKPVDKTEWQMPPQMVNAYYNPTANEIVFPAAILQPPFFYMDGDDAINYGAIGVVIGHEMTHGFDDQGRQYNKDGNLEDWWTAQDAERFKARTTILAGQYDQFTVLDTVKANGKLTLGENIADLGGLNVAYCALQTALNGNEEKTDGFTPEQRFFLAYAHLWAQNIRDEEKLRLTKVDVHSLGKYRVIGPLKNMPEFYKAFNIQEGDAMYLPDDQRAVIW